MKIEKTICPYCGASLKLAPGQKTAECEYCGNSMLLTNTEPAPYRTGSADLNRHPSKAPEKKSKTLPQTKGSMPGIHALLPPPGFRSRNFVHMLTAVIGYLFILCVALNMGSFLDAVFFTIASLSAVDICTGWTGAYARLSGLNSPNPLVRIAMKVLWSIVIFIAWIVIMVILEEFLT